MKCRRTRSRLRERTFGTEDFKYLVLDRRKIVETDILSDLEFMTPDLKSVTTDESGRIA
jgi:hypothetical protein